MEENVGFHGGEEGEASDLGSLVKEFRPCDLAVRTLGTSTAHNELNQINLLNHVLEGANVGVGNLASKRDVAKSRQVLEKVVGELVLGSFANDALKVLGVNESIAILIEQLESLADALALQTTQHLGELRVVHMVALLLAANVQLGPFALPVKRNAVGALVELIELSEVLVLDIAGSIDVEEAEGDLVLGVGLDQEVLKGGPLGEGNLAGTLTVGDAEQNSVLFALDFVLWR